MPTGMPFPPVSGGSVIAGTEAVAADDGQQKHPHRHHGGEVERCDVEARANRERRGLWRSDAELR